MILPLLVLISNIDTILDVDLGGVNKNPFVCQTISDTFTSDKTVSECFTCGKTVLESFTCDIQFGTYGMPLMAVLRFSG